MTTKYRACNLCEAICGLEIELEGNVVKSIRGDPNDPFSKGHICPKATALADMNTDPNRLRTPIRRTPTGWESISWEDAFTEVASKLETIKARDGANAIAFFIGNPAVHNSGTLLSMPNLIRAVGSRNRFSATSVDQLPQQVMSGLMLGNPNLLPVPDITRTQFWLILGANPLASNGSLMTAPDVKNHLKNIQARGGKVVVIDPRKTDTAKIANEHFYIKPASDAFLLLAIIHTLFVENLVRMGKLEGFMDGIKELRQAVQPFSPERVASKTGISSEDIKRLTREFSNSESAVAYGRIGLSIQKFGAVCQWLVYALNMLTGNFDRAGGMMFPAPALETVRSKGDWAFGRSHTRVRGLPEANGEFPVAALAEEILTEGQDQVRALIITCGNPVLSTPNGKNLETALESLEFMVAIDPYITETTRHAHIILPPAMGLETEHYDVTFLSLSIQNFAKYSQITIPKSEDAKYDWEIIGELSQRLGGEAPRDPALIIDAGLKRGRYDLSLEKLLENPQGIHLGELTEQCPERLQNPEKRIRLAPSLVLSDLERLENELETTTDGYILIGRRELRSNNSWMHHVARLNRDQPRCTALLHPDDATSLGASNGTTLRISSRVGSVEIPLEISPDMARGVVCIPHGYGHATRDDVANHAKGISINDLTDDLELDVSGNAALNGTRVQIAIA
jgi:anaerobic selenocysteine-containing dehydrogenase